MISPLVVTLYAAALVPAASSPLYEVDWDVIDLESWDGVKLRVRAGFPKLSGGSEERFPMVLMANSWSVPNVEYVAKQLQWAEAGYVVVEYDALGWWSSEGTIDLAGPSDMKDASAIIDYALGRRKWHVDAGAIATCGISYGAGIAVLAAAHDPRIKAAASLSGWGNLTDALYAANSPSRVWANLLLVSGEIFGREPADLWRIWNSINTRNNISGVKAWSDMRSPVAVVDKLAARNVSVFLSNNFEDRLFKPDAALRYRQILHGAGVPTLTMLNQGVHASAEMPGLVGKENAVFSRVKSFLDARLKRPAAPLPGPPVVVEERPLTLFARAGRLREFASWPPAEQASVSYSLGHSGPGDSAGRLSLPHKLPPAGSAASTISFSPLSGLSAGMPVVGEVMQTEMRMPIVSDFALVDQHRAATYLGESLSQSAVLCGAPNATLSVTPSASAFQLVGYLYSVDPMDIGTLLTHGPRTVWKDEGATAGNPLSVVVNMRPTCATLRKGHRVGFGVSLFSMMYTPSNADPALTVLLNNSASRLSLPWLTALPSKEV